ncbi:endo-beta-1,4-glucanase D [Ceratobasidium theobromae]|uniref:AA9 family lytic polysaccharide monooxygenase n=1 Tax=Ceratobasidium theobromae TaxID=1582974 RepID=A0A5N5QJY4_9AGAM|nr:endo-beta-1,4-glucanase D [Ceratobasidium theobromae]
MRLSAVLVGLSTATMGVHAHTHLWGVWINGIFQGHGHHRYLRAPPTNNPVKDLQSRSLACNVESEAVPETLQVVAGDRITFEWHHSYRHDDVIDPSYKGPISVYMAPTSSNGEGNVWVKIWEEGLNGTWATEKLRDSHGEHTITVPLIASGKYLLRPEIIALHEAGTPYSTNRALGAQFFMNCVQIEVLSHGRILPPGVSFPGAYNYTDPGLLFDIHNTRGPKYVVPGPKVWTGSKGGRIGHAAAEQSVHSHANSLVFGGGLPVGSWSDDGGFYGGAFLADPMPYHDDDFLDTPFHDFDFNETDTHDINFHDTTYHDTAYHDAAYHDTAYHDTDFHDAAFHDAEFHSSHNVASAKAPHASADSNHDLVPEHGQCGGHYWKGPTKCAGNAHCVKLHGGLLPRLKKLHVDGFINL